MLGGNARTAFFNGSDLIWAGGWFRSPGANNPVAEWGPNADGRMVFGVHSIAHQTGVANLKLSGTNLLFADMYLDGCAGAAGAWVWTLPGAGDIAFTGCQFKFTEFSVNRPIFILQGGIVVVSGCYSYLGKNTMAGQNFLGVASIDSGVRARFVGCDFAGLVQGTPLIDDAFTGTGAPPVVQGVSLTGTGAIHPTSEVGAGVVGTRITSVTSAMSPYSLKPLDDLLVVNSTGVTITVDAMQTIVGKVYR